MASYHKWLFLFILIGFEGGFLTSTDMLPCKYGEDHQFNSSRRCDGVWDCPIHGGDERGCGNCHNFECSHGSSSCYDEVQRCDGKAHCSNKADEAFCSEDKCGSRNGTFLCDNLKCIKEVWRCDNADDCGDKSDERKCSVSSRKVIIAAVIGALMCGLLLTVAVGCTCRLYNMNNPQRDGRCITPIVAIEEEIWRRQSAPPNYEEAMSTSRPADQNDEELSNAQTDPADDGDDVALLDAGTGQNSSGSFHDDDLLDALGATGQMTDNNRMAENREPVASSHVILIPGQKAKVSWSRPTKTQGTGDTARPTSVCDTSLFNATVNEQGHTQSAGSLSVCNNEAAVLETVMEESRSANTCLKCSNDNELVQVKDCHCTNNLELTTTSALEGFERSSQCNTVDPDQTREELKAEPFALI